MFYIKKRSDDTRDAVAENGESDEDDHVTSKKKATTSKMGFNGLRSPSFSHANKPAELFRKDLISAMKLPDSENLQSDDYFNISDPWRQEWERGVQVPVNTARLHEVEAKEKRPKEKTGDFKMPKKMLHSQADETFKQGCHELTGMQQLLDQVVRYDLDDLDVSWLHLLNVEREQMGEIPIHEWTVERVVEELEYQCNENMLTTIKTEEGLGLEYDEDVVCEVCRSLEAEDDNEMVFCDGCDICVHQACYGVRKIPQGNWLCRTCALGIKPTCLLCPSSGGAMKSTKSGTKWAHVSCALWIPEVSIGCPEKMEPITNISNIPASRWALICCLCKERTGACIQCSVKQCKVALHVSCAIKHSMEMKTILDDSVEADGIRLKAYCPKHSKHRERTSSDSECDTPRKNPPGTPKKGLLTQEEEDNLRAEKLTDLKEEFYKLVNIKEAAQKLDVPLDVVDLIYFHWKLKRKSFYNKPLLTPKTEEADVLEKQQEDSLVARMKMFVHLRQDLERVRNLCYMVSKREKTKKQYYKLRETVFKAQLYATLNKKLCPNEREASKMLKEYSPKSIYDGFPEVDSFISHLGRFTRDSSPPLESDAASVSSVDSSFSKVRIKQRRRRNSVVKPCDESNESPRSYHSSHLPEMSTDMEQPKSELTTVSRLSGTTPSSDLRRSRTKKLSGVSADIMPDTSSEPNINVVDIAAESVNNYSNKSGRHRHDKGSGDSNVSEIPPGSDHHKKFILSRTVSSEDKEVSSDEKPERLKPDQQAKDTSSEKVLKKSLRLEKPDNCDTIEPVLEKIANVDNLDSRNYSSQKVILKSEKSCDTHEDSVVEKKTRTKSLINIEVVESHLENRTRTRGVTNMEIETQKVIDELKSRPPFTPREKNIPNHIKEKIDAARQSNKLVVNNGACKKALNCLYNSKRFRQVSLKLDKSQRKIDYFFRNDQLNGSKNGTRPLSNPNHILNCISPKKERHCSENQWFGGSPPRECVSDCKILQKSPLKELSLTLRERNPKSPSSPITNLITPEKKDITRRLEDSLESPRRSARHSREPTPIRTDIRNSSPSSIRSHRTFDSDSVGSASDISNEDSSKRLTRKRLHEDTPKQKKNAKL